MRPKIDEFRKASEKTGGNLSQIAKVFKVTRGTVYNWINDDPTGEFKQVVDDARGTMFDNCLSTAHIVALGIPHRDKDGRIVSWEAPPDGNMLRYLLSTLGKKEGFGEEITVNHKGGEISPKMWVLKELEQSKKENKEQ